MTQDNDISVDDRYDWILPENRPAPEIIQAEDAEVRAAMALREQARQNYGSLLVTLDAQYADNVRNFERSLTERRQQYEPDAAALTAIHPDLFIVSSFLGFKSHEAIETIMKGRSVPVKTVTNSKELEKSRYLRPHHNRYDATAVSGDNIPYIILSTEYSFSSKVQDLEFAVYNEYANKHEGYHYLDDEFLPPAGQPEYKPDSHEIIKDPAYRLVALKTQWAEGFADIGAVGDLIREGHDIDLVDILIKQRNQSIDLGHYTSNMLSHFKETVLEMGVDKFRSIDQHKAITLYKETVRMSGMTEDEIVLAAYFDLAEHGQNDDKAKLDIALESGQYHLNQALDAQSYAKYLKTGHDSKNKEENDSTLSAPKEESSLAWRIHLLDRAFQDNGAITPETLSKSFITIVNELREKGDLQSLDDINKVKTAFAASDYSTSYVAENHVRGVDIFRANIVSIDRPNFDATYLKPLQNRPGTSNR